MTINTPRSHRIAWGILVCLLLLQFFLRVNHITHQPFFIDEHRHIYRAEIAFDQHPARHSMGKFLLYIWLFPFQDEDHPPTALHVSRTAIALFSLIGSAGLYAVARRLLGDYPALMAVAFYALAPFAIFYERMVLADGFAGAWGALMAWQSLRLAERPTYSRALMVGALVALAIMAKLTMMFSAGILLVAVLCFGKPRSPESSLIYYFWGLAKHYWRYGLAAFAACVGLWSLVLIPAAISGLQGEYYVLVDQSLLEEDLLAQDNLERLLYLWTQLDLMLSLPMTLLLIGALGLGLWHFPRSTLFALGWLILTWLPALTLVGITRTRYLVPGVFPIALIYAIGSVALYQVITAMPMALSLKNILRPALSVGVLGIWAALFALPFAYTATYHATQLHLPRWDENDYFKSVNNAYAVTDALDFIEQKTDNTSSTPPKVIGMFFMCQRFVDYAPYPSLDLDCTWNRYPTPDADSPEAMAAYTQWNDYLTHADYRTYPVYLILENKDDLVLENVQLHYYGKFHRPKNGKWVTVWRLCDKNDGECVLP